MRPHIDDFAIRQVRLVFIQRLIHTFVHPYPLPEVLGCLFWILSLVVRRGGLHLQDIAHDQVLFITLALNEQCCDVFRVAAFLDPATSCFGTVRGIEDSNEVSGRFEPQAHVFYGGFGGGFSETFALLVRCVEE